MVVYAKSSAYLTNKLTIAINCLYKLRVSIFQQYLYYFPISNLYFGCSSTLWKCCCTNPKLHKVCWKLRKQVFCTLFNFTTEKVKEKWSMQKQRMWSLFLADQWIRVNGLQSKNPFFTVFCWCQSQCHVRVMVGGGIWSLSKPKSIT